MASRQPARTRPATTTRDVIAKPARAMAGGRLVQGQSIPRWLPLSTVALSLAGLAVSAYLTVEHYTASTTLACPETTVINCQKVTTSPESVVLGIPVALLGLLFFAALLPVCVPAAWRSRRDDLRWGRIGLTVVGVGFVVYLVYTELFVLDAICAWCTVVHLLTVALFAVVAFGTAALDPVR
jgi:uncharacterized membrane protein